MYWSTLDWYDFLRAQATLVPLVSKPFGIFLPGEHEYCILINGTNIIYRPGEKTRYRSG